MARTPSALAARRPTFSLRSLAVSSLVFGCTGFLAGLAPNYLTFALLAPVLGVTALTLITSANGYMQMNTAASVRGRVMALYLMVMMGGTPLGAPFLGWVGEVYGARWTLLVGGGLTVLGVVAAVAVHQWAEGRRYPHFDPRATEQVA